MFLSPSQALPLILMVVHDSPWFHWYFPILAPITSISMPHVLNTSPKWMIQNPVIQKELCGMEVPSISRQKKVFICVYGAKSWVLHLKLHLKAAMFFQLRTAHAHFSYDFQTLICLGFRSIWQSVPDISLFIHPCLFNRLSLWSSFPGRADRFLHSWTCVLWTRQSLFISPQCLYFTDELIWQKNCPRKAIPQASKQFLPSFFTSIEKREGENWLLSLC